MEAHWQADRSMLRTCSAHATPLDATRLRRRNWALGGLSQEMAQAPARRSTGRRRRPAQPVTGAHAPTTTPQPDCD